MIICQNCHTENPDNANFCRQCRNVFTRDKFVSAIEGIHKEIEDKESIIHSLEREIGALKEEINLVKEKSTQQIDVLRAGNKKLSDNYNEGLRNVSQQLSVAYKQLKAETGANEKKTTAIFILVILAVVLAVLLLSTYNEKERLVSENSDIKLQQTSAVQSLPNQDEEKSKNEALAKLQDISTYANAPIIIKKIEIGNEDESSNMLSGYGEEIMSGNTMYLVPRIDYIALKNQNIKLFVKLFHNGQLSRSETSPSEYSYTSDVDITGNSELSLEGWGGKDKGHWESGNYRFEIWYNGYCIKALDFTIH